MKILVTGANGLLGQHLVQLLLQKDFHVIATGKGQPRMDIQQPNYRYYDLDIIDSIKVHQIMSSEQPEVVVHAAAMTQVDVCEQQPELCEKVNVQGTAEILVEAEAYSRHFIYISTDFVFDGVAGNYSEEDELQPVNWYGFTKMQAEAIAQTSTVPWAIVRTCLVYGNVLQGTRPNIITWVKDSLEQGKPIKVVNDQWRTPTHVTDLAKGILLIIEQQATGIYHISGKDTLTPYEMALQTAAAFRLDATLIEKVTADTFTQPGRRPPKTGFNIEKAQKQLGYAPLSFAEGLQLV